ncbi:MAG: hypothetical protein COU42_03110 [Candidatus Nealsonbacteria bacterium CG10_big_fil_rev_8_21_14_0_10_36_24]|uniref:Type 4a pilus biogenesis protein PilO n=2 Tax=Candidatus Nealsoniibacteriota TaxID=1817911 RepID=A0A2H0YNX2_9BACT|nr:MAG: hypothetical protein COU42_03110 [Candidatus Nealsonbacteria bacterium CG10_big_fil_rev_8_21_14_0_10_36_24]PIS40191.1 MAG: hypothetical protein COT32_01075 [Candidatus Nealsonbacteria bacterium CG08_land_8_20_14_0_20_36_22]
MNSIKEIILISVVFGILTLLLIVFLVYPFLKDIQQVSDELILLREKLFLAKSEFEKSEQFKQGYKGLESDLNKIQQFFINPEVPIDLIEFWEKTAAGAGLSINIVPTSLSAVALESEPWSSLIFRLNLTGSFPNFLKFLQKTERGPYLIEVQDINVKKLTEREIGSKGYENFSIGDVFVNLVIKVFSK